MITSVKVTCEDGPTFRDWATNDPEVKKYLSAASDLGELGALEEEQSDKDVMEELRIENAYLQMEAVNDCELKCKYAMNQLDLDEEVLELLDEGNERLKMARLKWISETKTKEAQRAYRKAVNEFVRIIRPSSTLDDGDSSEPGHSGSSDAEDVTVRDEGNEPDKDQPETSYSSRLDTQSLLYELLYEEESEEEREEARKTPIPPQERRRLRVLDRQRPGKGYMAATKASTARQSPGPTNQPTSQPSKASTTLDTAQAIEHLGEKNIHKGAMFGYDKDKGSYSTQGGGERQTRSQAGPMREVTPAKGKGKAKARTPCPYSLYGYEPEAFEMEPLR